MAAPRTPSPRAPRHLIDSPAHSVIVAVVCWFLIARCHLPPAGAAPGHFHHFLSTRPARFFNGPGEWLMAPGHTDPIRLEPFPSPGMVLSREAALPSHTVLSLKTIRHSVDPDLRKPPPSDARRAAHDLSQPGASIDPPGCQESFTAFGRDGCTTHSEFRPRRSTGG